MSTDLTMLVWSVILTIVQLLVAVAGATAQVGTPKLLGNREDMPVFTGWAGRASRAYRNMIENLVLFAIVVLVAQIAGKADAATALGAQLFFWARLAYAPIYVIGIPYARTAAYAVSVAGLLMILVRLL